MRIDHVAYPCRDPQETHRFYSEILGLKLVQAYAGKELILVYALPGGGSLVFNASREREFTDTGSISWQRHHVGLTLATRDEFDSWLRKLQGAGVRHQLIDDERTYFADPNGLVLELEVESAANVDPRAAEVLARWSQH